MLPITISWVSRRLILSAIKPRLTERSMGKYTTLSKTEFDIPVLIASPRPVSGRWITLILGLVDASFSAYNAVLSKLPFSTSISSKSASDSSR